MSAAATPQPAPLAGREDVTELVLADLRARRVMGTTKYGTPLMTFNGRDALTDAYQEALDLVMYLRQALAERYAYVAAAVDRVQLERDAEVLGVKLGSRSQADQIAELRRARADVTAALEAIEERLSPGLSGASS